MSDLTLETLQLLIETNDRRLNDLMIERDVRYQQRDEATREALEKAFGSAKEDVSKAEMRVNDLLTERNLRDQQRYEASRDALHAALSSAKEAVTKAEAAYEKRFDTNNEWKQTFSELSSKMVTRTEYSSAHEALKDKIEEVGGRIKVIEGKSTGIGASLGVVLAVAALLISMAFGVINFTRSPQETIHLPALQTPR
jgi:hypothetical protein